jgi:hypothetical protein
MSGCKAKLLPRLHVMAGSVGSNPDNTISSKILHRRNKQRMANTLKPAKKNSLLSAGWRPLMETGRPKSTASLPYIQILFLFHLQFFVLNFAIKNLGLDDPDHLDPVQ